MFLKESNVIKYRANGGFSNLRSQQYLTQCSDSPRDQSEKSEKNSHSMNPNFLTNSSKTKSTIDSFVFVLYFSSRKTSEAKLIFKIPGNILKPLEQWKNKLWAIKSCFSVFLFDSFICIFPSNKRFKGFILFPPLFHFFLALLHLFRQAVLPVFHKIHCIRHKVWEREQHICSMKTSVIVN